MDVRWVNECGWWRLVRLKIRRPYRKLDASIPNLPPRLDVNNTTIPNLPTCNYLVCRLCYTTMGTACTCYDTMITYLFKYINTVSCKYLDLPRSQNGPTFRTTSVSTVVFRHPERYTTFFSTIRFPLFPPTYSFVLRVCTGTYETPGTFLHLLRYPM